MLTNVETPVILRVDGFVYHLAETCCGYDNEYAEHGAHPARVIQNEIEASKGDTVMIDGFQYEVNIPGHDGALELVLLGDESEMGE